MSQLNKIRNRLTSGASITALDALFDFGCLRLAARIADLRDQGLDIKTTIITKGNKRFAEYTLKNKT
jgi:hypothetical protein